MNFCVVRTDVFRRDHLSGERCENRPHIIGTNDKARAFIREARGPERLLAHIFGPFYIGGCGSTLVDNYWEPSLRFQNGNSPELLEKTVAEIEEAFSAWTP